MTNNMRTAASGSVTGTVNGAATDAAIAMSLRQTVATTSPLERVARMHPADVEQFISKTHQSPLRYAVFEVKNDATGEKKPVIGFGSFKQFESNTILDRVVDQVKKVDLSLSVETEPIGAGVITRFTKDGNSVHLNEHYENSTVAKEILRESVPGISFIELR
jgi:hypothetical protein